MSSQNTHTVMIMFYHAVS